MTPNIASTDPQLHRQQRPIALFPPKGPLQITNTTISKAKNQAQAEFVKMANPTNTQNLQSEEENLETILTATPFSPDHVPSSWMELALQMLTLILNLLVKTRPVTVLIQNLLYLAQIIKEKLNQGLANFGRQLWLATLMQAQAMSNHQT
ncbi:hypothetical protein HAX54_038524 [Datura stramonium]|uniref:Uncharacterized protein n=1 Tax=Datura stramonium TaxID=4076 RepID=A0ABS8VL87_DATST|nr:hypothetical protein [Datura stramonium]